MFNISRRRVSVLNGCIKIRLDEWGKVVLGDRSVFYIFEEFFGGKV